MSLQDVFANATQLPSIPQIVQELIQSFNDPHADTTAVANKVAMDQALTAKLLRLANSSFYGSSRRIASAQDAVLFLGFDALRTLVMASGIAGAIKTAPDFDLKAFWKRSFAIAALCKWLVRRGELKSLNAETAFTAGMLHDLGNLLLHSTSPALMKTVDTAVAAGASRGDVEKQALGCTSVDVGAELARRWKFPESLCTAVSAQFSPQVSENPPAYAHVVYLAKYLYLMQVAKADVQAMAADLPRDVATALKLNTEKLVSYWDETSEIGGDMEGLLG